MSKLSVQSVGATVMRNNMSDVLDAVDDSRNIMLIKRRNRTDAALVNVELLEDLLALRDKQYVRSIREARAEAARGELSSLEDTFGAL